VAQLWLPARAAFMAAALLPALFPSAPLNPLVFGTPAPAESRSTFDYAAGTVEARVFRPASAGPHGGVVLVLGAGPLPESDLGADFASALAREGVTVVMAESSALLAERVLPEESEAFAKSYDLLLSLPDVDPRRTGLIGLSAGGGLAIVAAAQPPLRDRVRFVNVLGGYYDARELLVDVASRSIEVDGEVRPWEPQTRTEEVFAVALADTLDRPEEQRLLRRAFVDHEPVADAEWAGASDEAEAARLLLGGGLNQDRAAARAALGRLSAAARARLVAISPATYLGQVRARLYLMHDADDSFVPFTQTRALAAAAPPGTVARVTEFSIFEHVIPDRPATWQTFLPDLWWLFWHVQAVLMELA
jgi:dienelactone hydrolase